MGILIQKGDRMFRTIFYAIKIARSEGMTEYPVEMPAWGIRLAFMLGKMLRS